MKRPEGVGVPGAATGKAPRQQVAAPAAERARVADGARELEEEDEDGAEEEADMRVSGRQRR